MRIVVSRVLCVGALACAAMSSRLAVAGKGVDGVVNLNTADVDKLGLLPGVGPAKAAAIVSYRRRRAFRTVDELVRIKGIGRKMVRRLRQHLAVAGPTTAAVARAGAPPPPPLPPPAVAVRPAGKLTNLPAHGTPAPRARTRSAPRWHRSFQAPPGTPCLGPP